MDSPISVRPVDLADLSPLGALERSVWHTTGARILSPDDLEGWYQEGSPLFLVAERDGEVVGYYFGRCVVFSFTDIDGFIARARITDTSWHRELRHDPAGRVSYGVSTVSVVRGAGSLMSARAREIWKELGLTHSVGFTRLSGFKPYFERLAVSYPEDDVALWYAHASARMLGLRTWKECTPCPALSLPEPEHPDPVLAFHARGNPIGLLRIVPGYMPDIESRGYAAFIALATSDLP